RAAQAEAHQPAARHPRRVRRRGAHAGAPGADLHQPRAGDARGRHPRGSARRHGAAPRHEGGVNRVLQPPGWPRPKGYANGVAAEGRLVFVAGQIGWTPEGSFESDDLVGQVRQALSNTLAVLAEGGAGPQHVVRMTWYVTDKRAYLAHRAEI